MNMTARKARRWTRNWKKSMAKPTIWILHSSKWQIRDMLGNGESPSFPRLFISANVSLVSIEVRNFAGSMWKMHCKKSSWLLRKFKFFFGHVLITGDLHKELDVLEWLRKNRYRQPELNIYMYMLIAITILFLMYTGFLLSCFRSEPTAPVAHPKQAWTKIRKWQLM